ncbi:MAG TPA: MFS transporter [Candidatus Dormibacteraeota bacterium]|jgi:MFS family permease|nr:MFS transporter [Methylomirabilota bacterium]HWN01451.1 MFS transporter [Candidatus Dormibacteraeota bacterium]
MRDGETRPGPFSSPEARRLALLFAIVYFAQGMVYLPDQVVSIVFKERGLTAGQLATFTWVITIPWFIKPVYGLLSDFVPIAGTRRRSYFLIMAALATVSAIAVSLMSGAPYWALACMITLLWLGVGFTDVLTDALMVENGKPLGLTGTFQSVQWAALSASSILVGVAGGYLAEHRAFAAAFALVACFPLISLLMAWLVVQEPPARPNLEGFGETWAALRHATGRRDLWLVASFIFFWAFSPSFGPAFFYYQTDTLHFSQTLIGALASLGAAASIAGAWAYARLARRFPLKRLIVWSIGAGTVGSLAYLAYGGVVSATVITVIFGAVGMTTQLAFLDLAAKACPVRAEATFFALLMSINNLGMRSSEWTGANLYDWLGYTPLVLISTAFTAAAWLLVPLVPIDAIEAAAAAVQSEPAPPA